VWLVGSDCVVAEIRGVNVPLGIDEETLGLVKTGRYLTLHRRVDPLRGENVDGVAKETSPIDQIGFFVFGIR
jgi:hypothetical protein